MEKRNASISINMDLLHALHCRCDSLPQEGGPGGYSGPLEHPGGQPRLPPRPGHIQTLPPLQYPWPQVQGDGRLCVTSPVGGVREIQSKRWGWIVVVECSVLVAMHAPCVGGLKLSAHGSTCI